MAIAALTRTAILQRNNGLALDSLARAQKAQLVLP
jgi:hypothetical protein